MLRWWFRFAVVSSVLKLHQQCWASTHDISQAPPPHTPKQLHKGFWMIFDKSGRGKPYTPQTWIFFTISTIQYVHGKKLQSCTYYVNPLKKGVFVHASGWCPEGILDFCSPVDQFLSRAPGVAVYIDEDAAVPDLWRDEHGKIPNSNMFFCIHTYVVQQS